MGPAVLRIGVVVVFRGERLFLRVALCGLLSNSRNTALYQEGVDFFPGGDSQGTEGSPWVCGPICPGVFFLVSLSSE